MSEKKTGNTPWGLCLHPKDNVATLLAAAADGSRLTVKNKEGKRLAEVETRQTIQRGHKIAIAPIAPGAHVIKYGEVIGRATRPIAPGETVHVHNLESLRGRGDRHD